MDGHVRAKERYVVRLFDGMTDEFKSLSLILASLHNFEVLVLLRLFNHLLVHTWINRILLSIPTAFTASLG